MRLIKNITLGLAAFASVAVTGCSDSYMDLTPTSSVSDVTISSSVDNIYIALNGIHKEMVSQESGYQCLGGLPGFMFSRDWQADDITAHAAPNWYSRMATWSYVKSESSGYNYAFYRVYYQWILNANKILEALENLDKASLDEAGQTLYDQIKGEALVFRAFAHYDLVQQYAERYVPGGSNTQDGVIYRTSSEIKEQARESVENTYKLIEQDLDEAQTLLQGKTVNDVNHFDEATVWAWKARVALTKGEYANAASHAEKAIALAEADGKALMTGDQLLCGFADITSDTKEAMYAAMTPDDKTVYFYSFMAYMSWNFNSSAVRAYGPCVNKELYETMSDTDIRRAWWDPTGEKEKPKSNYAKNPYQSFKFTARSTSNAVCDVAFIRIAEMYLIAAEGYARAGGQEAKAKEVFTKFQQTRDPQYTTSARTGDEFITEIMNSRRVELWGEGQRMFDLKRLNGKIIRDSLSDASVCGFIEKDASEWVYEIPQHETDYNSLCTSNY